MIEGLWLILSALDVFSQYLLFSVFLKQERVRPLVLVLCYILQFTTYAVNRFFLPVVLLHTLVLILLTRNFSAGTAMKVVSVFTIYLLGMAAELTVYFLLLSRLGTKPLYLINILTSLMLFAYFFLIRAIKRKYQKPGTYVWAYFILFLSFLITIAFGLRESGWINNLPWIISMLLLSGLFALEKVFDYRHVEQSKQDEMIYALQLNAYERQLMQMRENQDQLRQLRHDFRNHLMGLVHKSPEQKEQYVQELSAHYGIALEQGDCTFLEHFLGGKKLEAAKRGVRLEYTKRYPSDSEIRDCDVIILLGNLLDNAIEAAQNTAPHEVSCTLDYRLHTVCIAVKNSTAPVKIEQGRPKAAKKGRGIGLKSVQRVVDTYGGYAQYDYSAGVFTARILLFEPVNSGEKAVNSA